MQIVTLSFRVGFGMQRFYNVKVKILILFKRLCRASQQCQLLSLEWLICSEHIVIVLITSLVILLE